MENTEKNTDYSQFFDEKNLNKFIEYERRFNLDSKQLTPQELRDKLKNYDPAITQEFLQLHQDFFDFNRLKNEIEKNAEKRNNIEYR